jgi:hypothetical protein
LGFLAKSVIQLSGMRFISESAIQTEYGFAAETNKDIDKSTITNMMVNLIFDI